MNPTIILSIIIISYIILLIFYIITHNKMNDTLLRNVLDRVAIMILLIILAPLFSLLNIASRESLIIIFSILKGFTMIWILIDIKEINKNNKYC